MPATSEARIAANRKNALKSRGPTSIEGKERSRCNGLKHGLTGRGVVIAEQDATEVGRRSAALMAELSPKSSLGAILVGQVALLSVRMERAARREEASLTIRVAHSAEDFEHGRVKRAEALFDEMLKAEDPRTLSRELRRSPEGIDRLLAAWADLRTELSYTAYIGWTSESLVRASMLIGMRPIDAILSRLGALSHAAQGSFQGLEPEEGVGLEHQDRRRWAADRLIERVDEEVAKLEAIRESLNHEAIEVARSGAADMALFDPSPEANRARRYESEARRGFFKALEEFRRAEAEAAELSVSTEVAEEEVAPSAPSLGSCRERPSPVARAPRPSPAGVAPGLVRPISTGDDIALGLDGGALTVGRATFGGG